MQLIYLYIGDIGRDIHDQHISFSDQYKVDFFKEEKKLCISKLNLVQKSVYGKNIIGIDLLVGRNGSGKSTIMELLGLGEVNRRHNYLQEKVDENGNNIGYNMWFAVYHLKKDFFCIEGYNPDALNFLNFYSGIHKHNYSAVFHFDFKNNHANDVRNLIGFNFPHTRVMAISKIRFLLYTSRQDREWYERRMFYPDEGAYEMFGRYRISSKTGNISLLEYLTSSIHDSNFKNIMETSPDNTALIIRLNNPYDAFEFSDRKEEFSQCIYGKIDSMIRVPEPNVDLQFGIKSNFTNKQSMVIRYLEILLAKKYDESKKKIMPLYVYEEIEGNQNKRYQKRKDYLLQYLRRLTNINIGNGDYKEFLLSERDMELINLFCVGVEKIEDKYFISGSYAEVPLIEYTGESHFLYDLMKALDENDDERIEHEINHGYYIHTSYKNLSSGEMDFIHLYANLKNKIDVLPGNGTCLLLLDEPDAFFHPEWSRRFIDSLTKILSSKAFSKFEYQILVATHSPILLADVPVKHIHCLRKQKDGKVEISDAKYGFLNNINTIMLDSMFVRSSFGSFAEKYVNSLLRKIELLEKQSINKSNRLDFIKSVRKIEEDLEIILEPNVRNYINDRLFSVRGKIYNIVLKENDKKIKVLMDQIRHLEMVDEFDG